MHFKLSAVGWGLLALCGGASAQDASSMFSISGFGTVMAVTTNTDDATYRTAYQKYGATTSTSLAPDSKLGVQLNGKFSDTFSATVQVMSKQDAAGSFAPNLEWAFAKARLANGFDVRIGRMGAPYFMTSDYRNVGYTNLMSRTPPDVYFPVPVSFFDGADVLYQGSFGDATINAQFLAGKSSALVGVDQTILINDVLAFNVSVETGPVVLRFGHTDTTLGAEGAGLAGLTQLQVGLRQLGAVPGLGSLTQLASDIGLDGKKGTFTGIGATVDLDPWVISAEYTTRKSESLYVADLTSWYTTVGYRVGKFTPYLSLSQLDSEAKLIVAPSTVGYTPQVQGGVAQLIAGVNSGVINNVSQKTLALGARWEAGKSYAVKAELARISLAAGAEGVFTNITGGAFANDTTVNVISVGVDFVF